MKYDILLKRAKFFKKRSFIEEDKEEDKEEDNREGKPQFIYLTSWQLHMISPGKIALMGIPINGEDANSIIQTHQITNVYKRSIEVGEEDTQYILVGKPDPEFFNHLKDAGSHPYIKDNPFIPLWNVFEQPLQTQLYKEWVKHCRELPDEDESEELE